MAKRAKAKAAAPKKAASKRTSRKSASAAEARPQANPGDAWPPRRDPAPAVAEGDTAAQQEHRDEFAVRSRKRAADFIAELVDNPPSDVFVRTGHHVVGPDDRVGKTRHAIQDGVYSDKQHKVRFEGGVPVEFWRADHPNQPAQHTPVGND